MGNTSGLSVDARRRGIDGGGDRQTGRNDQEEVAGGGSDAIDRQLEGVMHADWLQRRRQRRTS